MSKHAFRFSCKVENVVPVTATVVDLRDFRRVADETNEDAFEKRLLYISSGSAYFHGISWILLNNKLNYLFFFFLYDHCDRINTRDKRRLIK